MKYVWWWCISLIAGGLFGYALCDCSIQPQVTVDEPIVKVDLCLAVVNGKMVELVGCDAGTETPLDGGQ